MKIVTVLFWFSLALYFLGLATGFSIGIADRILELIIGICALVIGIKALE
jgi:hypothetical protein